MKAALLESLNTFPRIVDVPRPEPHRGQYLVHVNAVGVNYADTMMRRGFYVNQPKLPFIPGFEFSGVVEAVGPDLDPQDVGRRVMGFCQSGYAEYVAVASDSCMPVPESYSDQEGAAFPVTFLTAYSMLRLSAHAQKGETILIHAAGGGVGTSAVQLARYLGMTIIGTASEDSKLALARELGAAHTINYIKEDYVKPVLDFTHGRGADIIFEPNGGDQLRRDIEAAAPFGRIVFYGTASGSVEKPDLTTLFQNSVSISAFWMITLTREGKLLNPLVRELLEIVAKSDIRPIIGHVYPLSDVAEALKALESRHTQGKLLLVP